jgi:hypothetical protein
MEIPDIDGGNEEEETPGFLQKGTKKVNTNLDFNFKNPYIGPGFIDPATMKVNKISSDNTNTKMRFKQFDDPMFQFNNINYSVS